MEARPLILIDTGIIGGPGRGIIQLATLLASKGAEYLVCTFKYRTPMSQEFVEELGRLKLRSTTIPQSGCCDPTPLWQFLRLARRGGFNIIQSHGYKSHLVAFVVSRALGIPWVAFAHGWTKEDRKVAFYHSLDTFMLRFSEVVIAVSPPLTALFSKMRGRKPTKLVLNAVDGDSLRTHKGSAAIRHRLVGNGATLIVGCFGRLSFEKGQDILIRALVEVFKKVPGFRVVLLGDGPEWYRLRKLSEEVGIGERITFEPHTPYIRDYYEALDLLVVPSRSEGLPNVILEAMWFGVPVIATDVGAVREIVTDGETGWLVPPGDEGALARGLVEALSDREKRSRFSTAGRRLSLEKFSPINRGEKIIDVYRELLKGRGCPT